jgi:hypothetical protein
MHVDVRGGLLRARCCVRSGKLAPTKDCSEWEGTSSSRLIIDVISKPDCYCSSASPKVHVSGSQRTKKSSTRVYRRPCLIRMGLEPANMWCMTALSPTGFDSGADLSFVAQLPGVGERPPLGWEVGRDSRCMSKIPLGKGSRRVKECCNYYSTDTR